MTIKLGSLVLPDQLLWVDEFDWSPVAQVQTPSITGAMIVEESAQPAGRPITLKSEGGVWVQRSFVIELKALESQLQTQTIKLTLHDGRQFDVYLSRTPVAITATPLWQNANPGNDELYEIDIKLIEVTP